LHETRAWVSGVVFRENRASLGAGIHCLLSDMDIESCIFSYGYALNDPDGRGGAIYIDGALRNDLTAPLANGGKITFNNSAFEENLSTGKGAGIYVCLYNGNAGGGPHVDIGIVSKSSFCGNINNSTIEPYGAAIQYDCSGSISVSNSTFGGNSCPGGGTGSSIETVFASGGTTFSVSSDTNIPGVNGSSPGTNCPYKYYNFVNTFTQSTTGSTQSSSASTTNSGTTSGSQSNSGSSAGSQSNSGTASSQSGSISSSKAGSSMTSQSGASSSKTSGSSSTSYSQTSGTFTSGSSTSQNTGSSDSMRIIVLGIYMCIMALI